MTTFDHIEVHVKDIQKYIEFLKIIFEGGESKKLSDEGTSMLKAQRDYLLKLKKLIQKTCRN